MTKTKPKTKAVATRKPKKELVWAGANQLLSEPTSKKEVNERALIIMVSQVVKISPFGVNILGGQPYINNLGLKQKLESYNKGAQFTYDWKQIATDDEMKAVVMVNVVDKSGKELLKNPVIGEASNKTMGMSTLHGYQNHIAQTRGENRAIRALCGVRIHEEMLAEIGKRMGKAGDDQEERQLLAEAALTTNASAEEINTKSHEDRLFEATIERIDQIKDDQKLLKEAMGKIGQMDISQAKAQMLKAAIKSHLDKLRK